MNKSTFLCIKALFFAFQYIYIYKCALFAHAFAQLFGRGVVCGQVFAVLSAVAPASMLKLDVENEREVRSNLTFRSFESLSSHSHLFHDWRSSRSMQHPLRALLC
jgi:hypothetical protein